MRLPASAVLVTSLLAGCLLDHGEFHPTPCKPHGAATYGTLLVRFNGTYVLDADPNPIGRCVALEHDGRVRAAARVAADGTASLNVPVQGRVYITWTEPMPADKACAAHGFAFADVPGPSEILLEVGRMCY